MGFLRNHLCATFYRRSFYRMMKENMGDHRSARHRQMYAFDCALFLYMHRLLWIAYVIHTDFAAIRSEDIDCAIRNDAMLALAYSNRRSYDAFTFVGVYLFCVFYWYCEYSFWRINPSAIIWRWWYQLVVLAQDEYRAAALPSKVMAERRRQLENRHSGPSANRRRVLVPSVVKGVYRSAAARAHMWWTLSNVDQRRMFARKPPLVVMPNMTHRARRSSILFLVIGDYVAFGFQTLVAFAFLAVATGMVFSPNKQFYTHFGLARMFAEIYAMHYITQRFVRSGVFCTSCSLITTFIYVRQLIKFYDQIRSCVLRHNRERHVQKCSISNDRFIDVSLFGQHGRYWEFDPAKMRIPLCLRKQCGPTIKMVLIEHNQMAHLMLVSRDEMFGGLLFAYLCTNLPINVYILQRLAFEPLSPLDSMITSIVFFVQSFAALVVIWPMGMCTEIFHSVKRFLPGLQAVICSKRWLRLKLKYDDLCGRLVCGPKIGMSIGPMDAVTYKIALETILLYIAFFMMSFKTSSQPTRNWLINLNIGNNI